MPGFVLLYLEELHSDASKHELQEGGDNHDVADGSDGHKYTLHHVLQRDQVMNCQFKYTAASEAGPQAFTETLRTQGNQTHSCGETHRRQASLSVCFYFQAFGSVDGPERTEDPQNTEDLHH